MKRTLLSVVAILLLCLSLIVAVEQYDQSRQTQVVAEETGRALRPYVERLQGRLDELVRENRALARVFEASTDWTEKALEDIAADTLTRQPRALSVVASRQLKVVFVYPAKGNETLIGLDYGLSPDFMGSINRAIATGYTVIDAPARLRQNWRTGFIARTPIFLPDGEFAGQVSMAIDLDDLLSEVGLLDPSLPFTPVMVRRIDGKPETLVFGSNESLQRSTVGIPIDLLDGNWAVRAEPKQLANDGVERSRWIRLIGGVVTFMLLWLVLRQGGLLGNKQVVANSGRIGLRVVMWLFVFIPTLFLVGGAGWFAYRTSSDVAKRMELQQASELSELLRDKVVAFFDVPRQVDTFNAELFRQGLLHPGRPDEMVGAFLAQFRQQPLLTFLSMGNADGEYFGVSRPPLGDDKTLRVIRATIAEGRTMRLFRVDDVNRPAGLISVGTSRYDARERPWFQAAVAANSLKWYSPYRYAVNDTEGRYDALGIGMSAPLYDSEQRFIGVMTADVALSQLGDFLKAELSKFDGIGFISEADGNLLATSSAEPIFRLDGANTQRIRIDQSDNPSIRIAGAVIQEAGTLAGNRAMRANDQRFALEWQSIQLPDGPTLTIALALPESRFSDPVRQAFQDIAYLIVVLLVLGWVTALLLANWFSQPLLLLEQWARRLGAREWGAQPPAANPIREIASLSGTLDSMAKQLQQNTEELERRVVERTEALEAANRRLAALSATDGLTGIANRRRFDEVAAAEWARSARSGAPLALLLLDVDQFKLFNDHYGHPAGDEALKQVANTLRENTRRPGDLAARYGGEEFVVIAADTAPDAALVIAESIRAGVEALGQLHAHSSHGVLTVSIGVAVATPGSPTNLEALLTMVDAALYKAKHLGRNRVEMAEPH